MPVTTDPTVIGRELESLVSRAIREVTIEATANLIESTPVDTGWARANWIPAIGSPTPQSVGSERAVSTAMQQAGLASLLSYRLSRGPVWISNKTPYIRRLDGGWSKQAPAGFVRQAIARAVSVVQAKVSRWRP